MSLYFCQGYNDPFWNNAVEGPTNPACSCPVLMAVVISLNLRQGQIHPIPAAAL